MENLHKKIGLALFVYIRPDTTQSVIESIRENEFDEIYVFQDGLKKEADREKWNEVNSIIKKIDFAKVHFIEAIKNKGLANSIIEGVGYVLEKYERVIALEDDIVLAKQYKEYMEICFDTYEKNKRVMCVAGGDAGHFIPDDYSYDIFFSHRMFSQAWGTWRDRWKMYRRDLNLVADVLSNESSREILYKAGGDILPIAEAQLRGECDSWAIFWVLMQIKYAGVCALPCKELASDIGHSGGGTNSKDLTYRFDVTLSTERIDQWNIPKAIIMNEEIIESIRKKLTWPTLLVKYKYYYSLLTSWINLINKGESIQSLFIDRKINSIYIYGAGKIAHLLISQIEEVLQIKGIIVEYRDTDCFDNYPLYDVKDDLNLEDEIVIITTGYDKNYVNELLAEKLNAKNILDVMDIVKIGKV